ncbi:YkvA family protein [Streptomyces sp. NPDC060194]|uniref:YkvA family protein n=1 Tax=Streptomyces sp. NPDC060194 TaxID=3347069 RepID=UPI0036547F4E
MSNEAVVLLVIAAVLLLAAFAAAVVLLVRLLRTRTALREAGIPVSNKLAFWGALVYTVSPVDLLPDPVYLDDIGVLLLALRSLHSAADAARTRARGTAADRSAVGGDSRSSPA